MAISAEQFLCGYEFAKPINMCTCGQKIDYHPDAKVQMCSDCRYEKLGELIESHPIVSPRRR